MRQQIPLMLDLNILLDVLQRREPFYAASAAVLTLAHGKKIRAFLPAHAISNLYFIVRKAAGRGEAEQALDRALSQIEIASVGEREIRRARDLDLDDFEDALVASAAESAGCHRIVTRDAKGFAHSPVAAASPEEILIRIALQSELER